MQIKCVVVVVVVMSTVHKFVLYLFNKTAKKTQLNKTKKEEKSQLTGVCGKNANLPLTDKRFQ